MFDPKHIASSYIALWNETDAARRDQLAAALWTEDAHYIDPHMQGQGPQQINTLIQAIQQQFPGHAFTLHGAPESHNDRIRFSWTLGAQGKSPIAVGTDFGVVAADGRLHSITGFLDVISA